MKTKHSATLLAILAAALYAINIPLSKILLVNIAPTMMYCPSLYGQYKKRP